MNSLKNLYCSKTLVITMAALCSAPAFADLRLSLGAIAGATGVDVSSSSPSESANLLENKKFGYGLGAMLEVPMTNFFGLQTGAMYVHRRFDIENASVKITRTAPTLVVPIEAKIWILDFLNASAGGFTAFKVGDTKDEVRFGNTTVSTFSSDDRKFAEFGLTAAIGVNFPIHNKTGIFAEARYNHGLTNSADNGTFEEKIRDVLFMAGVRLDFGGGDDHHHHDTSSVESTETTTTTTETTN